VEKMNKNLNFERTLKTEKEIKSIFKAFQNKFKNSENFILKKLSETDYKKLTFADYEIICFNLNIKGGL